MPKSEPFSKRRGFDQASPIVPFDSAPEELRKAVIDFAFEKTSAGSSLLQALTDFFAIPHPSGTYFDDILRQVRIVVSKADWFEIYDLIEYIYRVLSHYSGVAERYAAKLDRFLARGRYPWKFEEGLVEVRSAEAFNHITEQTIEALKAAGLTVAATEIHEALHDLSRRPSPDLTGAVQHAMAALECVAREAVEDPKATLGQIISRYPGLVPSPLSGALERVWGYSSEMARHVREGRQLTRADAELMVALAGASVTYLTATLRDR